MIRTLHGSETAHLEHQPGELLDVFGSAGGVADLTLSVIFIDKVDHDRAALKDALGAVEECGNAAVRVDLQEPAVWS
jgi:hypothetical protein